MVIFVVLPIEYDDSLIAIGREAGIISIYEIY